MGAYGYYNGNLVVFDTSPVQYLQDLLQNSACWNPSPRNIADYDGYLITGPDSVGQGSSMISRMPKHVPNGLRWVYWLWVWGLYDLNMAPSGYLPWQKPRAIWYVNRFHGIGRVVPYLGNPQATTSYGVMMCPKHSAIFS